MRILGVSVCHGFLEAFCGISSPEVCGYSAKAVDTFKNIFSVFEMRK